MYSDSIFNSLSQRHSIHIGCLSWLPYDLIYLCYNISFPLKFPVKYSLPITSSHILLRKWKIAEGPIHIFPTSCVSLLGFSGFPLVKMEYFQVFTNYKFFFLSLVSHPLLLSHRPRPLAIFSLPTHRQPYLPYTNILANMLSCSIKPHRGEQKRKTLSHISPVIHLAPIPDKPSSECSILKTTSLVYL